jgi:hypothetical protein
MFYHSLFCSILIHYSAFSIVCRWKPVSPPPLATHVLPAIAQPTTTPLDLPAPAVPNHPTRPLHATALRLHQARALLRFIALLRFLLCLAPPFPMNSAYAIAGDLNMNMIIRDLIVTLLLK